MHAHEIKMAVIRTAKSVAIRRINPIEIVIWRDSENEVEFITITVRIPALSAQSLLPLLVRTKPNMILFTDLRMQTESEITNEIGSLRLGIVFLTK